MNKSDVITSIAALPEADERLARIGAILSGKDGDTARPASLRLLRVCDFVRASGTSRSTVHRMIAENRLKVVRVREGGSPRIPETELLRIVEGGK